MWYPLDYPYDSIGEFLFGPEPIVEVQNLFGPDWLWFFRLLQFPGTLAAVAVVASLALWLSSKRLAYALVGIAMVMAAINVTLWTLVGLDRPDAPAIHKYTHVSVPSFPSGHVATATVLWGLLAWSRRIPMLLAFPIIAGEMLSRLYLGVHYVADVIAGALLGLLVVLAYVHAWPAVRDWFADRSFTFVLILSLLLPVALVPALLLGTTRSWPVLGAAIGAAVAVPVNERYLDYEAGYSDTWNLILKSAAGLAGLGAVFLARQVSGNQALSNILIFAFAVIWILIVAPLLFSWLGLTQKTETARSRPVRVHYGGRAKG